MSKKLILLLLTICTFFCLSACGTTETSSNPTYTSSESQMNTAQDTDENKLREENSQVSSNTEDSKENNTTQAQPLLTNQSKPTSTTNQPTHTHSYSNATCTSPKKCSCGVTAGTALGHQFSSATCTSPQICDRCGITSGNALGHTFEKYVCTECNFTDEEGIAVATNPKLNFKPKIYFTNHYKDEVTIQSELIIFFPSDFSITWGYWNCLPAELTYVEEGFTLDSIPQDSSFVGSSYDRYYTIYNGKKYYCDTGSSYHVEGLTYKLTDSEIVVSSPTEVVLKFKMNTDGNLIVTYSTLTESRPHTPIFNVGDICW